MSFWPGPSAAESRCKEWIAAAVSIEGVVDVRRVDAVIWTPVELDDTFCAGDSIRVADRSRAALMLVNETVMRLDQATAVTLTEVARDSKSLLDLLRGAAHFISRVPRSLTITTPFVNAGVEGTEFIIRAGTDDAFIAVFEGTVIADNSAGSIQLTNGQSAAVLSGRAPQQQTVVQPREAVEWTLHYPPVIDFDDHELAALPDGLAEPMTQSIAHLRSGDTRAALDALNEGKTLPDDPRFFTYRASLLLSVGRVGDARADIDRAVELRVDNPEAVALRSIIAVAGNDPAAALQAAEQATTIAPNSMAAHLAQSYAHQAVFHLDIALEHARIAVTLQPESAVAWARLAELRLMHHDLIGALAAAEKAVTLNPDNARARTVLGFAELIRLNTVAAIGAFDQAITLDTADPLARLGLGLAQIRRGSLETGRRNMEIAAVLDPNRSLIRSYLGKAYYEERRDGLAGDQFAMARELDPNDPTPWLYDAVRKQAHNQPVQALNDLRESIARNGNRAVYRSRLMLDEDQAVRLTSQASIYRDLGFDRLALLEGWKSLNEDPANYSAHRFLAESYASRPRHEIARVSSLLQSQLLQPVNAKPARTQLAESELFIPNGSGPTTPSFNEFGSLYAGDGLTALGAGIIGGNDTTGTEVILSGVKGNTAVSASQFRYDTDGFRVNNDQEQDIYSLFVQSDLTYRISAQAEIRSRERKNGDIQMRFDPSNFSPDLRTHRDTDTVRLGLRLAPQGSTDILLSVISQDMTERQQDSIPGLTTNISQREEGVNTEAQLRYRGHAFNLVTGARHFTGDVTTDISLDFGVPCFLPAGCDSSEISDSDYISGYLYTDFSPYSNLSLLIGASIENYDDAALTRLNESNPKLGILWSIANNTILRLAAFRTLRTSLVNEQTLEPIQIAGFTQYFDDLNGTISENLGIGVDHVLSRNVYTGLQVSSRNMEVYFRDETSGAVDKVDWDEISAHAYLNWAPTPHFAISIDYQFERFERDTRFVSTENVLALDTNRLRLGLNVFHENQFTARIGASYITQDGDFFDPSVPPNGLSTSGDDQFWIVDTTFDYRLKQRYGIISLEIRNLFDEDFKYQDMDAKNPIFQPGRTIFGRVTIAL